MAVSEEGAQEPQSEKRAALIALLNRESSVFLSSYRPLLMQCLPGYKQGVIVSMQQAMEYASGVQGKLPVTESLLVKLIGTLIRALRLTMLDNQSLDRLHGELLESMERMQTETDIRKLRRLVGKIDTIIKTWREANNFEGEEWPPRLIDGMATTLREFARSLNRHLGNAGTSDDQKQATASGQVAQDVVINPMSSLQRAMQEIVAALAHLQQRLNED
jgi:hypothetical protein